jgi:serpin B
MTLATRTNAFGLSLWWSMPGGNMAFSPASIATTLAMVWTGARSDTARQMATVLQLDGDADRVAAEWGALAKQLQAAAGVTLRIANRLYGHSGYAFVDDFRARLETAFGAPMETVDFAASADRVRTAINAWVAAQTERAIANLLPAGALDASTRLVLVNAVYFRGLWAAPFAPHLTVAKPFWSTATTSTNVPTMHHTGSHTIGQIDGGRIVVLPYRGNSTAMVIARPDERDGLDVVERGLSADSLARAIATAVSARVELALPRFTADPPVAKLNSALAELGMPLPFDAERADFTAMANPGSYAEELYLAAVFHKAYVKTDEQGTVAAAATAASMVARGRPASPEPFHLDRPFAFFIVDTRSGLVLFMGRIVDPGAA